jgi:hypothetical protein
MPRERQIAAAAKLIKLASRFGAGRTLVRQAQRLPLYRTLLGYRRPFATLAEATKALPTSVTTSSSPRKPAPATTPRSSTSGPSCRSSPAFSISAATPATSTTATRAISICLPIFAGPCRTSPPIWAPEKRSPASAELPPSTSPATGRTPLESACFSSPARSTTSKLPCRRWSLNCPTSPRTSSSTARRWSKASPSQPCRPPAAFASPVVSTTERLCSTTLSRSATNSSTSGKPPSFPAYSGAFLRLQST